MKKRTWVLIFIGVFVLSLGIVYMVNPYKVKILLGLTRPYTVTGYDGIDVSFTSRSSVSEQFSHFSKVVKKNEQDLITKSSCSLRVGS